MARPGPPMLLTEQVRDAVILDLAAGGFLDEVAGRSGVSLRTLQRWRLRGQEVEALLDAEEVVEDELPGHDALCLSFSRGIERARSSAVVRAQAKVHEAMDTNWRAAAWYLERTNPRRYGRPYRQPEDVFPETPEPDDEAQEAIKQAARDWKDRKERQQRRAAGE